MHRKSTASNDIDGGAVAPTGVGRRDRIISGPVGSTLFFLALPVLGEQVLNFLVGLVDTYLAGQISPAATSAIGLAVYVSWFASMIVMLVGTGTTALVSRHAGASEHGEANHMANQSLTLAALLGVFLLVLFVPLAPLLARFCGMEGESFAIAVQYLRIEAIGYVAMSLTLVGCAGLRGVGNMRTPMYIYAVINAVNVIASLTFVHGWGPLPAMGISGIVAGTLTARMVGVLLTLGLLIRGRSGVTLRARELPIDRARTRRILRIGIPAATDGATMWMGHFIFLGIVASLAAYPLGQAYFAVHIIAMRVEALTYLPAFAWATATANMIGQALGAGDPARARRVAHLACLQCGVLAMVLAVVFFLGAEFIYDLMSKDVLVRAAGVGPFRVLAWLQIPLAVSIIYIHALRGAGDTRYPLLITIGGIAIRVGVGYLCGVVLEGGLLGAWFGMFGDMLWRASMSAIRYTRGHWVKTKV